MLIDTHCHLSDEDYKNIDEVIDGMKDGIIITSGIDDKSNKDVLELCSKYSNVYGTLGIHPESIDSVTEDDLIFLEKHLQDPKIVAVGEIGLDYYWVKDNKEKQKELFIRQLRLAEKYNKAVVIHSRDSIQDTYDILKQEKLNVPIDIHCYSGSLEMANEFIKLGCKLGIGGVVTFKNGVKLQDIVKNIGLEHLLLETDGPYLSPEPYRGCQNVPANSYYIASKIAEIKGISVEEVIKQTAKNATSVFDLPLDI